MGNIRVRNLLCHMLTVLFPVALGKISLIEHKVMENFDIMSPEEVQWSLGRRHRFSNDNRIRSGHPVKFGLVYHDK